MAACEIYHACFDSGRNGVSTGGGLFLHNGNYETTFKGASLTFNKQLSNRWMMRGNFSYNDWYYSKAGDRPDPTILEAAGITDGSYVRQGDAVLQSLLKGCVWISSDGQAAAAGRRLPASSPGPRRSGGAGN